MMIVKDDFSRYTRVVFLQNIDEAAEYCSKCLAEIAPHKAEVVRSDVGGDFYEGESGYLCRREKIRQEFTTSDTPEYNGVAERQIGIIESADITAKIQASVSTRQRISRVAIICGQSRPIGHVTR